MSYLRNSIWFLLVLATLARLASAAAPDEALNDLERREGELRAAYAQIAPSDPESVRHFQAVYDEYQQRRADFLIDAQLAFARRVLNELGTQMTPVTRRALTTDLGRMNEAAAAYAHYRDTVARDSAEDRLRAGAIRDFLASFGSFRDRVGKAFASEAETRQAAARARTAALRKGRLALSLIPALPRALFDLAFHRGDLASLSRKPLERLERQLGLNVEVKGMDHIPPVTDPHTLNVFLPVHMGAALDMTGLVPLLDGRRFAIVGAVDRFGGSGVISRALAKHPQIIATGGSPNPVRKITSLAAEGKLDTIVLYPQGTIPDGLTGQVVPPQQDALRLLRLLARRGFHLNLIPISAPRNFRLENDLFGEGPKALQVIVHAPLSTGDPDLGASLRQIWIDDLQRDGQTGSLFGMPPIRELIARLNTRWFGGGRCGGLMRKL